MVIKNKDELHTTLRKLHKEGVRLNSYSLQNNPEHRFIYEAAKNFYEGRFFWENTLNDAGLNVDDIVIQRRWNKNKAKEYLKERSESGLPMNTAAVKDDDTPLYKAVITYFRSWDSALRSIGLSPKKIRKTRKPYTVTEIIKGIISYHLKGEDLNPSVILKDKRKKKLRRLVYVSDRKFDGGWEEAVETAGIDYSKFKIREREWDKEKVKGEILKLHERGEPLNTSYVMDNYNYLYRAGCNHLGSWEKAIEYTGLDYDEIRKISRSLSKKEVISEIKRLHNMDVPLDITSITEYDDISVRTVFYQACVKFDGGWEEAVNKAGFDYNEIRLKGKYTGEGLKRKVLELYEDGTSLRAIDIQNDPKNKKYHRAVIRRYDSWYDFLEEIGIDSSEWISRIDWKNGETVIEVMNGMFSEGIVTGVSTKDIKLEYAAQKYFGTIEEAAEQAGLVYSKSGKIRKDMIERNPEILKVLIRRNRDFIRNIAKRVYWGALGRGFPSIEMEDLFHEAIIAFIETIPKKPPKVGLRRFCYKNIYYRLLNMNKKYVSEKLRHIPFKKIEFMLGEEEFD